MLLLTDSFLTAVDNVSVFSKPLLLFLIIIGAILVLPYPPFPLLWIYAVQSLSSQWWCQLLSTGGAMVIIFIQCALVALFAMCCCKDKGTADAPPGTIKEP